VGDYSCELTLAADNGDKIAVPISLQVRKLVSFVELSLLTQYWLMTGCDRTQPCSAADWYIDENINLRDFNQLALSWLREEIIIDSDYIAYWKLNETTGNIAHDSAMYGLDGSLQGDASWAAGYIDNAISLDGNGDYIDFGNTEILKPPLPITISAWIKLDQIGLPQTIINIDKKSYDASNCLFGPQLLVLPTGQLSVSFGDGQPNNSYRILNGTFIMQPEVWYHVAAIIQGPDDMSLYINGLNDEGTIVGIGSNIAYSNGTSQIGCRNNTEPGIPRDPYLFFSGDIDDIRVYNRALPESEIQNLASN